MMSLQTMLDPERARGLQGRFGFRFGEIHYSAELREGRLHVLRGVEEDRDAIMTTTPEGLAAVIYGGAPIETIGVEGDLALARRFVTLFPLPDKAA
jgi:hypothetical protein